MVEEERFDEDSRREKILDQNYDIRIEENKLNINNMIKQMNKYKHISSENYEDFNKNSNSKFYKKNNIKRIIKYFFSLFYCLLYKSFKRIYDGRHIFRKYYRANYSFFENILFSFLSIIDIIVNSIYKENLTISFYNIRIISDSCGILIFWLTKVIWDEEFANESKLKYGFKIFTFIDMSIMGLLDIFSFVVFCASNSDFTVIVLLSFLIHLILSIALFSFNLCKYMN